MNYKLIGINGFARSGKDSLFEGIKRFCEKEGFKGEVIRVAFADPLKKDLAPFIKTHYGIDVFTDDSESKKIIRPLVVGHGDSKRNQDSDHWIKKALDQIDKDSGNVYVFTDVRYPNEAEAILDNGGNLVRISRDGNEPANNQEAGAKEYLEELSSYKFKMQDFEKSDSSDWKKWLEESMEQLAKSLL